MDSSVHNSINASVASSALFLRRARMSFVRHHFCDNHACIMVKVRTKIAWNGTGELFLASWHSVSSPRAETTSGVSEQEAHSWFSCTGYCVVPSCGSLRYCGGIILYRSVYNLLNSHIDLEGRFVLCCFSFRDITFNISCLYAPNRNPARNDFFEELADSTVL